MWADRCITWNWVSGALGIREIPDLSDIKEGVVSSTFGIDTWEATFPGATALESWDSIAAATWGYRAFESMHPEMVMSSPPDQMIRRSGGGLYTLDGENMKSEVERTGLDLGDPGSIKRVNAVWPKISTTGPTSVEIQVCGQMTPDEPPRWGPAITFNPLTQSKVSCRATGKYFGWRIKSDGFMKWQCHGVEFNVEQAGSRGGRVQ
jgi:hypothetical protein